MPTFDTNVQVQNILLNCNEPVQLVATGGDIAVADAGGGECYYNVRSLDFEDVSTPCGSATLTLSGVRVVGTGLGTAVTIPYGGGAMTGNHPITIEGTVTGTNVPLVGSIAPTVLADFDGILPPGTASFGADSTTADYNDTSTQVAQATTQVSGFNVTVTLSGFDGAITLETP